MSNYEFDPFLFPPVSDVYVPDEYELRCNGCKRHPDKISRIDWFAEAEGYSDNAEFVKHAEGTYNPGNGHFWCDECYIKAGVPLGQAR